MKFILGTKKEMTQIFDEDGRLSPATVISVGPVTVTQVKTTNKDGYPAIQVGFGEKSQKNVSKAVAGHLKKNGPFRIVREFRTDSDSDLEEVKIGDSITADVFAEGDIIRASGVSKGKGFQGGVKRHGFAGGPRTHGQKHSEREPGSIGAGGPQRVFKGTRMAGRMGGNRVTVNGLKVLKVDKDSGTLVVSGAVPGRRGTVLEIRAEE